jgi:hypothetical protein
MSTYSWMAVWEITYAFSLKEHEPADPKRLQTDYVLAKDFHQAWQLILEQGKIFNQFNHRLNAVKTIAENVIVP